MQATMPELPAAMKARFEAEYGLSSYDAATLTASREMADYFVATVDAGAEPKPAANWLMGVLAAKLNAEEIVITKSPVVSGLLAELVKRITKNEISNNSAKILFEELWQKNIVSLTGTTSSNTIAAGYIKLVDSIIADKGLKQESDSGAIEAIIDEVLAANPAMVEEFKAGREKAFNALVGQAMKASKGKANPAQVNEILKKKLVA